MRALLPALAVLIGCSPDAPVPVERHRLTDPLAWTVADPDPLPGKGLGCGAERHGSDPEIGEVWYTTETQTCGHVTVTQPLGLDIPAGSTLTLRAFRFQHTRTEAFALKLGMSGEVIAAIDGAGPAAMDTLLHTWVAARDYGADEPLFWSVDNDGANSWSLATLHATTGDGPLAHDHCAQRPECATWGACSAVGRVCVPTSGDHCVRATVCTHFGLCALGDGRCVAGSDTDCTAAAHCVQDGWCGEQDGGCVARTREHCLQSEVCRFAGRCSHQETGCVALTDEDCALGELCTEEQSCTAESGECVP